MASIFNPTGTLNIAWDAADLQGQANGNVEVSGMMTRCKNLRTNQNGKLITRDGSRKINASAIDTNIWLIKEMDDSRYTFAGTFIYQDESSIATGLTDAKWSGFQYNAFNDTTNQIFALNGTDRKRITDGAVNEWGIAAPTVAPTLTAGGGGGLTGTYNAKYTYVRKVGTAVVAESNPSPAADFGVVLSDQSLAVSYTTSSDSQVTHVRLYRTLADGETYYLDTEIASTGTYAYGYGFDWEEEDAYIAGTGYKYTVTDSTHGTENTYTWEESFETLDEEDTSDDGSDRDDWYDERYDSDARGSRK
jgi:hypothetical protein